MAGLDPRQLRAIQQMFAQQADKNEGLLTFRAGRLFLDEQTRMVTADKKRGKIKLLKDEQGLLKFQWYNRISNQKELDLTVFPQSGKWEKINECKDGRVYVLRMIGSNRKYFFWMQEPKNDKDDEYFKNINKLCNGESISSDDKSSTSNTSTPSNTSSSNNNNKKNTAQSQQDALTRMIMQQLTGQTGVNNNTSSSSSSNNNVAPPNNNNNLMEQMRNMLQNQQRAAIEEMKREPDLEDILDPTENEEIIKLLDDEKIVEELGQHLPENMRTRQDIIQQLQSPQFQGSLRRLQSAVNGPQMPMLLSQMGIQTSNQNAMGVTAFVNAIQPNNDKKEKEKEKEKEKDKTDNDGDTNMSSKDDKDKEKDKDKDKSSSDDINDIYK